MAKSLGVKLQEVISENEPDFCYKLPANFDQILLEKARAGAKKHLVKDFNDETPATKPQVEDQANFGKNDQDAVVNFKGTAKCGVSFFSWNIEGNTLMKKYRITIRSQDLNRYICQRQPLNLPEF